MSCPAFGLRWIMVVLAAPAIAGLLASSSERLSGDALAGRAIDFSADIRPVLSSHCFPCHGADEGARKARLRLDVRDEAVKDRGGFQAIVPGDAEGSEVLERIMAKDPGDVMPPPKAGPRLKEEDIALIRRWIDEGAHYAEHWAWSKPSRPSLPEVKRSNWPRNEIDRFILARLEAEGLEPSAPADAYALIRRVTLDLTGLPPTPEEVRVFVSDADADAYERLVDRLLDSPAYGERWARVWLDLARYADSAGYGSDPLRPDLWPWRDWVIDALNRNLPYDEFTVEQLAGDLLPDAGEGQLVATAFHRNTMTNTEGGTDDEEYRIAAVKDRANVTAQVWMGLTLGCAQCHSHKYDPVSHAEYYGFFAFFNQTEDNDQPDERPTLPLPNEEQRARIEQLETEIADLEKERGRTSPVLEAELASWESKQAGGIAWTPFEPVGLQSLGGATLETLDDLSVLASGTISEKDVYVMKARVDLTQATAIRLEWFPHDSLPHRGLGRAGDRGHALLTELQLSVRAPDVQPPAVRYVRVELPGPNRVLSLAEVEVWNDLGNVALEGSARQSTTDEGGDAGRAVDGMRGGDFEAGSTTLTRSQDDPWWELDLGVEKAVEEIVIWNRTDAGLGTRLVGFHVRALGSDREVVWEKEVGSAPTPVSRFRVANETVLKLRNASANLSDAGFEAGKAIDGNLSANNGWGAKPCTGETLVASFEIEGRPVVEPGSLWVVTMNQQGGEGGTLGRFRVSATSEPPPVRELPREIRDILSVSGEERSDSQRVQLMDYFRELAPSLVEVDRLLGERRKALAEIKPVALPVMRELPPDQRRITRVLNLGNFLDPGDPVDAGVPSVFHPLPEGVGTNRLGLARWLVSRENPLTARVAANRWWAQLFGVGLVETEEDFGTQGSLPTHPELLDWLAVEFMDRDWDVKGTLKTMVLSATYQQSARVTAEQIERDPRNRLYARAPRKRLEAELIRDQALALSGLLSPRIGGPSVFPPQPDGLWRAAFNDQRTWTTSEGEDRYRRGLYTFWRRTVPYPGMALFDAPSRETCTVRRLPTNTPLQAFATLNDPVHVEAAQALARRIVREGGTSVEERVRFGLELCLARPATAESVSVLAELYELELDHYGERTEEALRLSTEPLGPLPKGLGAAEAAAWTSVANALLNLDGVLTRG
jgi:hypothetical protein